MWAFSGKDLAIDCGAWTIDVGKGPLVATAIHDGHRVRDELQPLLALSDSERLREEDPFTGRWTAVADHRICVQLSRFEVDLNRPREKCVYLTPLDAWGLQVWKAPLPDDALRESLALYDRFYHQVDELLAHLHKQTPRVLVYDLHTYNHRRDGAGAAHEDPARNPDINLGTGTMNRNYWAPVVERFLSDLSNFDFLGRRLDVRENVKFQGGHFARWIHQRYPDTVCVLAIEVKKFFMDEWTGQLDDAQFQAVLSALHATVPGALEELENL